MGLAGVAAKPETNAAVKPIPPHPPHPPSAPQAGLQRIAILGAESTGKSWLTKALSGVLQRRGQRVCSVDEVLRDWCAREGRTPAAHEQALIAQQQAEAVESVEMRPGFETDWIVADTTPLMTAVYSELLFGDESLFPMAFAHHHQRYQHTLLTGLDLPWVADGLQRDGAHVRGPVDRLLRQALARAGMGYRVVYGQGQQRLNNALLALGLESEDENARQTRENAQFAINQGRTVWQCQECSDPDCEHKLFTGLLTKRPA